MEVSVGVTHTSAHLSVVSQRTPRSSSRYHGVLAYVKRRVVRRFALVRRRRAWPFVLYRSSLLMNRSLADEYFEFTSCCLRIRTIGNVCSVRSSSFASRRAVFSPFLFVLPDASSFEKLPVLSSFSMHFVLFSRRRYFMPDFIDIFNRRTMHVAHAS